MIITKEWIMANQTARGSWNAKQLACLDISWPAPKGWIKRVTGLGIDLSSQISFEKYAGEPAKDKISVQDQERRIKELEESVVSLTRTVVILVKHAVKQDGSICLDLCNDLLEESK